MPNVTSTLDMATESGKALLDLVVTQQAAIIAYANDYRMLLVLSVAAMPLVLLVGSSKAVQRPGGREAHAMD
jgi:DHA2 family multidrug resistance protein